MRSFRGNLRLALLLILPLVAFITLIARSQAQARLESSAAREAVLSALAALLHADAPAPPTEGVDATPAEAKLMDTTVSAFLYSLTVRNYPAAWELVHPEARGQWTLDTWEDLRRSMEGGQVGAHTGNPEAAMFMLMGRKTELKEVITRGMDGMAHVVVNVDTPGNIVLRKTRSGEWAVDLAATDDADARRKVTEQLAATAGTNAVDGFIRMMMMSGGGAPPLALLDSAPLTGRDMTYTVTAHKVTGDQAVVTVRGTGAIHLALPLANGDKGWIIAWYRGIRLIPSNKTVAQLLAEQPTAPPGPGSDPRNSACQSNLKQLALGMLMYAQDYDERFPPAKQWQTLSWPYVKNRGIFTCPSDNVLDATSYAMNYKLSMLNTTRIVSPAETFVHFESDLHVPDAYDKRGFPGFSLATPPRHQSGNNYAFADGHVMWLTSGSGRPRNYPKPPYPDYYRIEKTGEVNFPWSRPEGSQAQPPKTPSSSGLVPLAPPALPRR